MSKLIDFFETIINSLSGLWSFLFKNLRTIIFESDYFNSFQKVAIQQMIPKFYLDLNLITLISVGFIAFLLVWSLIKVFTNIL